MLIGVLRPRFPGSKATRVWLVTAVLAVVVGTFWAAPLFMQPHIEAVGFAGATGLDVLHLTKRSNILLSEQFDTQ